MVKHRLFLLRGTDVSVAITDMELLVAPMRSSIGRRTHLIHAFLSEVIRDRLSHRFVHPALKHLLYTIPYADRGALSFLRT